MFLKVMVTLLVSKSIKSAVQMESSLFPKPKMAGSSIRDKTPKIEIKKTTKNTGLL